MERPPSDSPSAASHVAVEPNAHGPVVRPRPGAWMSNRTALSAMALALAGVLSFGAAALGRQATIVASGETCPAGGPVYEGRAERTPSRAIKRFAMVSAYHLEPYSEAYLDNVLADLARQQISGIVYTALGEISKFLREKKGLDMDEMALNRRIFSQARRAGADIWLQMRVYANDLQIEGEAPRTLTAEEILVSPAADRAFRARVREEFRAYNDFYKNACTVVVFEEAGIYHPPEGGGFFWSSLNTSVGRQTPFWNRIFAERMAGIFEKAQKEIKSINPNCSVGMHLGHSVFIFNPSFLEQAIDGLKAKGAKPDFIFYDFYLESQPDFDAYASKLADRARFITQTLRLPAYHLAQLHTMWNFHGAQGKTPSREEIDRIVELSSSLGYSGMGFYSLNASKTLHFENDPFDPNTRWRSTVYESSKDRWDYGMLKLQEISGVDFRKRFDLVVQRRGDAAVRVYARNAGSNQWELLGLVEPPARRGGVSVFRGLDADRYLRGGRALAVKFEPAEAGRELDSSMASEIWVIPSEPSRDFQTGESLAKEVAMQKSPSSARSESRLSAEAPDKGAVATVCIH